MNFSAELYCAQYDQPEDEESIRICLVLIFTREFEMIAVVQRVSGAKVVVDGEVVGQIGKGLCVLTAVHKTDSADDVKWMASKLAEMRVFPEGDKNFHLDVRQYENVDRITGEDNHFDVFTTDRLGVNRIYQARKIVLATGYYDVANRLNVPGEELEKCLHYYKEAHPYYDQDVAVIGAKNSAAIAALELFWTGARVTLIHRGAGISSKVKYWIKPNIENRIKNGEIPGYFHSTVLEILPEALRISTPEGERTLKNDFVFALIGYQPDLKFLNATGISLEPQTQRPKTDPQSLESDRAGVYLAGVIVAGMHTNEIFIENGRFHGAMIAQSIASKL